MSYTETKLIEIQFWNQGQISLPVSRVLQRPFGIQQVEWWKHFILYNDIGFIKSRRGTYGLGSLQTKWLAYTHMLNIALNVALYSCYVLVTWIYVYFNYIMDRLFKTIVKLLTLTLTLNHQRQRLLTLSALVGCWKLCRG